MSSPSRHKDSIAELSKSYDDHMKSFEAQIDRQSVSRSPKSRSTSISGGKSAPKGTSLSPSLTRANSNPKEVIIGFQPIHAVSSSPEDLETSGGGAVPANDTSKRSPLVVALDSTAGAPKGATGGNTGSNKEKSAGAAPAGKAERGPKVDMKSLTKAEKRALAQKQQELSQSRRQPQGKKAEKSAPPKQTPASAGGGGGGSGGGGGGGRAPQKQTPASSGTSTGGGAPPAGSAKRKTSHEGIIAEPVSGAMAAVPARKRVPYFMHLPEWTSNVPENVDATVVLHPEVIRLGIKYANGSLCGSSARCVALVKTFECVVRDYVLPPKTEFSRHFYESLKPMIRFLVECRPKAESMGNFIRGFKNRIAQCRGRSEEDAKAILLDYLEEFIEERFLTAQQLIVDMALKKIVDGDVVMVYGCSYVVSRLLVAAFEAGRRFQLVVVDGDARHEGKEMMHRMSSAGIPCTYVLLNAISYMMTATTKVFLGAAAMLCNGSLVSRVGTALVAMAAHSQHVPVIVCCETIKFSEKCILDSITWNELGDPNELKDAESVASWEDPASSLTLLSLRYDVTPMDYLDMIVCEFGMIPPTSVPVVLREMGDRIGEGGSRK